MDKKKMGLYRKFKVVRTDGKSAPGEKHCDCSYFVLDLDHDKHAMAAIKAYAESCRDEYPALASDLDEYRKNMESYNVDLGTRFKDELSPCPFCGEKADIIEGKDCAWVKCEGCNVSVPEKTSRDALVEAWNRRKQS